MIEIFPCYSKNVKRVFGILVNCSYQCDFAKQSTDQVNCSYQCDFAKQSTDQVRAEHLEMRIASRDALAPTKDISCSSIW